MKLLAEEAEKKRVWAAEKEEAEKKRVVEEEKSFGYLCFLFFCILSENFLCSIKRRD